MVQIPEIQIYKEKSMKESNVIRLKCFGHMEFEDSDAMPPSILKLVVDGIEDPEDDAEFQIKWIPDAKTLEKKRYVVPKNKYMGITIPDDPLETTEWELSVDKSHVLYSRPARIINNLLPSRYIDIVFVFMIPFDHHMREMMKQRDIALEIKADDERDAKLKLEEANQFMKRVLSRVEDTFDSENCGKCVSTADAICKVSQNPKSCKVALQKCLDSGPKLDVPGNLLGKHSYEFLHDQYIRDLFDIIIKHMMSRSSTKHLEVEDELCKTFYLEICPQDKIRYRLSRFEEKKGNE